MSSLPPRNPIEQLRQRMIQQSQTASSSLPPRPNTVKLINIKPSALEPMSIPTRPQTAGRSLPSMTYEQSIQNKPRRIVHMLKSFEPIEVKDLRPQDIVRYISLNPETMNESFHLGGVVTKITKDAVYLYQGTKGTLRVDKIIELPDESVFEVKFFKKGGMTLDEWEQPVTELETVIRYLHRYIENQRIITPQITTIVQDALNNNSMLIKLREWRERKAAAKDDDENDEED